MKLALPSAPALPAYREELALAQAQAIRVACLAAAPLLVVFTGLDWFTARAYWLPMLGARLMAAGLLVALGDRARRPSPPVLGLSSALVLLCVATIEFGVFVSGRAHSPYVYAMMIVLAGVSILVPFSPRQTVVLHAEIIAAVMLPLLVTLQPGELLPLATVGSYLVTIAIVGAIGAVTQDRLRRREYRARMEMARQVGLVNLGTLSAGLAHELASPLMHVQLELEMVMRGNRVEAADKARLEAARASTHRLAAILDAIRSGSRAPTGDRRAMPLGPEIQKAAKLVESRLKERGAISFELAEVAAPVNPTALGQVLVNLLLNAADAVGSVPGRRGRIWVRLLREPAHARIEVEDDGPGVPEALRERIFEPFFSTKGEAGNGLGLWISAEIARSHGGSLRVTSGRTGGALFQLLLPFVAEEPGAEGLERMAAQAAASEHPTPAGATQPIGRGPDLAASPNPERS